MCTAELPEAQQIYDELILALLDEFRKIRETLMHASRHVITKPNTGKRHQKTPKTTKRFLTQN
ncbi:MAG: hypothetical protein OEZ29_02490 [Candidatus Bathyarchaeota archaeon]|nr:hypothetical protein [Candidatus Bathyarchaeota archaeon]